MNAPVAAMAGAAAGAAAARERKERIHREFRQEELEDVYRLWNLIDYTPEWEVPLTLLCGLLAYVLMWAGCLLGTLFFGDKNPLAFLGSFLGIFVGFAPVCLLLHRGKRIARSELEALLKSDAKWASLKERLEKIL